jgi:hypothetical protein
MITLADSLLSRVWKDWCIEHAGEAAYNYNKSYNKVSRRTRVAESFEQWLFPQGAIVQRINKKCYLQFTDPEEALIFRLRYA